MPAQGVEPALDWITRQADPDHPPVVLVMGSLYLAGDVLRRNDQAPT